MLKKAFYILIVKFFLQKNQKSFQLGKIRLFDEEIVFFEKNSLILLKDICTKIEWRKYAGGGRPSCFVFR